ncbi:MAG TPA: hypothetical protein VM008_15060 [Phycisphaerae bacterium]|nr:hypothetical protein [Phycisphaerae bacterium]
MADQWATIQAVAGKALSTKIAGQIEPAKYGLDRALRIVRCMERLAPSCGERVEKLELAKMAALYATVAQNVAGPGKVPDDEAYNDASELAADQLKDLLGGGGAELDTVLTIMKEHRKRETTMPEAKVLADALAMEEFGLVGLWNQTRQFHAAGKTLEQLLKLWKAQHDYGYWESRLRDGFHYDVSRRAAQDRLGQMRGIYERLQREHLSEDVGGNPLGHY